MRLRASVNEGEIDFVWGVMEKMGMISAMLAPFIRRG